MVASYPLPYICDCYFSVLANTVDNIPGKSWGVGGALFFPNFGFVVLCFVTRLKFFFKRSALEINKFVQLFQFETLNKLISFSNGGFL